VWPDDFSLSHRPPARSMDTSPALAMRALMRETPDGGSRSPYAAWTYVAARRCAPTGATGRCWD
jgi:hypothetical protein